MEANFDENILPRFILGDKVRICKPKEASSSLLADLESIFKWNLRFTFLRAMRTAVLLLSLSRIQHSYGHNATPIQTWQRKWGGSTKVTWEILNSHTINLKMTTYGNWFAGLSRGRIAIGNIFWLRTHLRGRECNINYFLHVLFYFLTKEEYFSAWTFYYIIDCWQGLVFCTLIFSTGKKLLWPKVDIAKY